MKNKIIDDLGKPGSCETLPGLFYFIKPGILLGQNVRSVFACIIKIIML